MNYPLETRPLLIHKLGDAAVNPGAGHCIYVMGVYASVSSMYDTQQGYWEFGSALTVTLSIGGSPVFNLTGVDQSVVLPYNPRGWFKGAPGATMQLTSSGGSTQGVVWYTIMREPSADGVQ